MADLDAILAAYEKAEPETARLWRELTTAAVGLGAAMARFDEAAKTFGDATRQTETRP